MVDNTDHMHNDNTVESMTNHKNQICIQCWPRLFMLEGWLTGHPLGQTPGFNANFDFLFSK